MWSLLSSKYKECFVCVWQLEENAEGTEDRFLYRRIFVTDLIVRTKFDCTVCDVLTSFKMANYAIPPSPRLRDQAAFLFLGGLPLISGQGSILQV